MQRVRVRQELMAPPVAQSAPHVLRLITRVNIGGPARQAFLLTKALSETFPTTLSAGRPLDLEGELFDPAVWIERVSLVRQIELRRDMKAVGEVRSLLKQVDAKLIHTHMAKAGVIGRIAAITSRPRPKIVHTFHGHVLEAYFKPLVEKMFVGIERKLAKRSDVLIAISPEVRDSLLALGVGREEQFRIIPLGFDLTEISAVDEPSGALRQRLSIPPDVPLVGVIGRLAPVKDHDTLFRAIALLPDVHLAVVGDGELRDELEATAVELAIEDRVHFAGWRSDVAAVLADLDLVALTSKNEGTPVSLIEALAAGKPIVATDVGGVRFVVDEDATGLIRPAGDPEAIAEAIGLLLGDPARCREMGELGRRRIPARFGHKRLISDIEDLYAELLTPG